MSFSRRSFLTGSAALGAAALLPGIARAIPQPTGLIAKPQTIDLFDGKGPITEAWSFGSVPGPVLRVRQGETLSVALQNDLPQPTTIHWHGLRLPNAMDGVPHLTQAPVKPGETFDYRFVAQDAGTFWYHPHVNSAEQVARGLSGALIVEEATPPEVDRDLVWVLDDWRLQKTGALAPFGNMHDLTHGGRLGNVATVNGKYDHPLRLRAGERVRLRLINVANARVFGLKFLNHDPWRLAVDGHGVAPERLGDRPAVVPPGGRLDLILDATGTPGDKTEIHDVAYARSAYMLAEIHYSEDTPLRTEALPAPARLAANPVPTPDLANAETIPMAFQGGAMGGMAQARYQGQMMGLRELASLGMVWAVNGEIIPRIEPGNIGSPLLDLKLGRSYILRWGNETAFDHPIHLHGHSVWVLGRNGTRVATPEIQDTVLVRPRETVEVAFVADNPGDWALHCHVLEHAEAGMMGFARVS
ncbi:MAG: multicopper oxidase family protein [Magnetospiraceae bacterium]